MVKYEKYTSYLIQILNWLHYFSTYLRTGSFSHILILTGLLQRSISTYMQNLKRSYKSDDHKEKSRDEIQVGTTEQRTLCGAIGGYALEKRCDLSFLQNVPKEGDERISTRRLFQTEGASKANLYQNCLKTYISGGRKFVNHKDICPFITSMPGIVITPIYAWKIL